MAKKNKMRRRSMTFFVLIILGILVYFGLKMLFPMDYVALIDSESEKYGIDPYLITAMIHTESRFDEKARSTKNAQGLMQIMESTWEWALLKMGTDSPSVDPMTAEDNLEVGTWYLHYLNDTFTAHDEKVVLAAYNAGEGNVRKWLKDPLYSTDGITLTNIPFPETHAYVERIERAKLIYQVLYPNVFKK